MTTIESSADKLLSFADNLRINRQYEKSLAYYDKAAELYLLKNDKRKYLTSLSRIAIVHLKMNHIKKYELVLKSINEFNSIENINFNRQIDYLKAKRFEYDNNAEEAIKLYNSIANNLEHIEQKYYYKFQAYKLKSSLNENDKELIQDSIEELDDLYQDGKLEYIELYSSSKFIHAELAVKYNDKAAEKAIQDCEKLYNLLEYTAKIIDVYTLYLDFYTVKNQPVQIKYYEQKIETHKKLYNIYLN